MFYKLLNFGSYELQGEQLRQRMVWNIILLFAISPNPLVAWILFTQGASISAWLTVLHIAVLLVAFFARSASINTSAVVCLLWTSVWSVTQAYLLKADLGIELVLCAISYIPLLVVDAKFRTKMLYLDTVPMSLGGLVFFLDMDQIGLYSLDAHYVLSIRMICFVFFLSISILTILVFIRESQNIQQNYISSQDALLRSERLADIGSLAAGVAHEINNPASIAMGNANLIYDIAQDLPEKQQQQIHGRVKSMLKALERIVNIVRSLRQFSSDPHFHVQEVRLEEAVANIENLMSDKFKENNIEFTVVGLEKDITVKFSNSELGHVFLSLIQNSYEAVLKSQKQRWIQILIRPLPDFVEIKIVDSGEGIDPEKESRIFSPFETSKQIGAGSGLGLSVSYGIIKSFGGDLFFDAKAEHTTFTIRLKSLN